MVSGTKDPTQQALPPTPSSAEEEALKRNTDCVYFLASPLTCKKGSECEYRHSENARLNPRDCWYWLNGNCLNPKCAFRHPPLDGLLGTQVATSAGSSMPPLQIPASSMPPLQSAASPATHTPHNLGKQAVPCIFFQKGLCLKGDRCSFLHGPNPISNKVPQAPAATLVSEPPTLKKAFGGLEKCTQRQKIPQAIVAKPVEVPHEAKPAAKAEAAPPKNGVGIDKYVPPPTSLDVELARYRATIVPPVINGNSVSRPNRMHQAHVLDDHGSQNGKDTDELLRESSPGFDVLVDDELGDSDYYHNEDQFGRTRGHEDRNLNSINEFDIGRSADYNSVADVDREVYRDPRGYDSYDRMQGQYAWEQHRASSERMLMGAAPLERRSFPRAESPDQIVESDLRHRLSKHRRVNGLRSVITHDYAHDNNVEERSYRGSSRRDSHHLPPHESSLSSRLRGRIKLPGRLSPVTGLSPISGSDLRPERERETDRGRNWGRLSPGRPQISSQQGRLQDRIKGRVQEDFNNEGRNFRGPRMRRDIMDDKSTDFAAPKSLAELKVGRYSESKEQEMKGQQSLSIGRQKYLKIEGNQQSEEDLSFEGPKPLSVILKRKRGAETTFSGSGISSDGKEDDTQRESKESLIGSSYYTAVTETQSVPPSASELSIKEESKSASADAVGTVEEDGLIPKLTHGQSSQVSNAREIVTEDGMIVDEAMEDHELEAYDDQRDGDYDYEQVDGEDFNLEEGENADPEEEYLDDEDGDDFAKKIGVMFS